MKTSDFHFDLPDALIAQQPAAERTGSRLFVLDKDSGEYRHENFRHIINYLHPGDCLVLNDTKVLPARLHGHILGEGKDGQENEAARAVELLLLSCHEGDVWEALAKPAKHCRPGVRLTFGEGILTGAVTGIGTDGTRLIQFSYTGSFEEILDRIGEMPLPPYIKEKPATPGRYQTVYARHAGSAAAPTAGLHFTDELLEDIKAKGVSLAYITLHVGLGTFRPVRVADVAGHQMHAESYEITPAAADIINEAKKNGGRIIAVGTTACRTLEAAAKPRTLDMAEDTIRPRASVDAENDDGAKEYYLPPSSGQTDIFIYPSYRFKLTDALITNFHLPGSTLIMLVAAFAGHGHIMAAYAEAIRAGYRFYSFGDAMLIHCC